MRVPKSEPEPSRAGAGVAQLLSIRNHEALMTRATVTVSSNGGKGELTGGRTELADLIDRWLKNTHRLPFDPFRQLHAGADPHLSEYLYGRDEFKPILTAGTSLVFAPAGGGKTALRVWVAEMCRTGMGAGRYFPVVYDLPEAVVLADENELREVYEQTVSQAMAWELFLYLAYRPGVFLGLPEAERATVRALLERDLPIDLTHFLSQLEQAEDLVDMAAGYDRTAHWDNPPQTEEIRALKEEILSTPAAFGPETPVDLSLWLEFICGPLSFEAVFLLLDGVDALPNTIAHPEWTLDLLAPLWELASAWSRQALYLKAFLPIEFESEAALRDLTPRPSAVIMMNWTAKKLAEMLELRLEAVSRIEDVSLAHLSERGLKGVEASLVEAVMARSPLPRELLVLTERLLEEHVNRDGPTGRITAQDLDDALGWYSNVHPTANSSTKEVAP